MKKCLFLLLLSCMQLLVYAQNAGYKDSLKSRLEQHPDRDTVRVKILNELGQVIYLENADSGLYFGQQALLISRELNYKRGEAFALNICAWSLWMLGAYDKAAEAAYQSGHLSKEINDAQSILSTDILIANIYRDMGDYGRAISYATLHMDELKQINPVYRIIAAETFYAVRGSIYLEMGRIDSASYYIYKADSLDKINGIEKWNWVVFLKGGIEQKRKNYEKALDYYWESIPLSVELNATKDILDTYNNISAIYLDKGMFDSCVYFARESLARGYHTSYQKGLLDAYTLMAEGYKKQHRPDSAIAYLEKSMAIKNELYNVEKTKATLSLDFNEILKNRELELARSQYRSRLKFYITLGLSSVFLILSFIFYRNNRNKQRTNLILRQQKEKVETTLSELRATQAQLVQSEKMASLGELTAGIAHEIQNPLNFVNNFSEVNVDLLSELKAGPVQKLSGPEKSEAESIIDDLSGNMSKINEHGKRADAIVKSMLQHSRTSSGHKEPADINAMVDEYLKLAYHGMRAKDKNFNVTLETDFDPAIGPVNVIQQDIGRVLLNLYNNAFYAVMERSKTAEPGYNPVVKVSTALYGNGEPGTVSAQTIQNPEYSAGHAGTVVITVTDNGTGIPESIRQKIFQPFFTTKPTGQGTGLGLSLSYDILKAHGGVLRVETKEGEGAEFIIQLPLS